MSSPPNDTVLSSSPTSVRDTSPARRRDITITPSDSYDPSSRPRHSPVLVRSYDVNDPEVRERQRTMDVDMAIHLSRARRETISSPNTSSYENRPSPYEDPPPHAGDELKFTPLTAQEQQDLGLARGERMLPVDHDGVGDEEPLRMRDSDPVDLRIPHLSQAHDPSLLVSMGPPSNRPDPEDTSASMSGLPTYQANISRSNFDFGLMETFAAEEKVALGISSPELFSANIFRRRNANLDTANSAGAGLSDTPPMLRPPPQRKLSQSNSQPRRKGIGGKMALFEGNAGERPPTLPGRLMNVGGPEPAFSAIQSIDDMAATVNGVDRGAGAKLSAPGLGAILNTGHDRPYRFSFYSNALSATIHARSLCELPADDQTFEDLFNGSSGSSERPAWKKAPGDTAAGAPAPIQPSESIRRTVHNTGSGGGNSGHFNRDVKTNSNGSNGMNGAGGLFEGDTWWLDVQSPTDEEMKMLSKVFFIHPLTTEDIQMEETREKIELFRNYYFVCFRGFDQDQYSPTYLDPLNMYIIVFREGILSFHFRPTPHPQNVRRRIKQLKDYISVTSDWISYALIDDITDAFGPLIQSIEYEVDSIDELVLILKDTEQSDMLRRIGTCRKKVMGLLRLMGNKADVVKGLAKRCNENWRVAPTSDIGLYLSDIQDHLITMTQNLNHYEKILSRSHSNYLAQISIEMTDANNQINDVLSKLTALGTILIPMNLVTGLWGMNVHVPGQDVPGYAWFISIIACLAAFAVVGGYSTYKFMRRR